MFFTLCIIIYLSPEFYKDVINIPSPTQHIFCSLALSGNYASPPPLNSNHCTGVQKDWRVGDMTWWVGDRNSRTNHVHFNLDMFSWYCCRCLWRGRIYSALEFVDIFPDITLVPPSCLLTLQRQKEKVVFRWEWNCFTSSFQNEHKGQVLAFWPKTVRLFASLPCFEEPWIIHPCSDADGLFSPMLQ